MLQNNPVLKSKIDSLWNTLWGGGISNPLTAIEQISYLIFMKKLDDNETNAERNVNDGFWKESDFNFRFKGDFIPQGMKEEDAIDKQELRWQNFKHRSSEDLINFMRVYVFPFLKELNGKTSPFTKHMQNAVFII